MYMYMYVYCLNNEKHNWVKLEEPANWSYIYIKYMYIIMVVLA